ncbi:hypothetical protein A2572_02255 [Candidatus Collierbacteria bacterium RIFOXYD1_FULL_40_9]|uniref:DUF7768 domain-containing protein n=1 Tax=Candidatus Collierbacteria bacterium RIFOXYD1_FULL_40_9 TaxID=1817731 RepID=A0A1F5FP37_9BACT|nr:MAG: hypothetical protein A2572_02255 [Candidatus Collierbacteria bacterium RIFOXYD1_FULL_40_9]
MTLRKKFKRVIVETPFKGKDKAEEDRNITYARACARDCLVNYDEAPFLSHLLYTQEGILKDGVDEERWLGINAGLAWGEAAEATVVYIDLGTSVGMQHGITNAIHTNRPIFYRKLPNFEKLFPKTV